MDEHNASTSRLALAATGLALLSMTACKNDTTPSAGASSPARAASSAAASSSPASSSPASAPAPSGSPASRASAARACTSTDLRVALGPVDSGAGQRHTTLDFRTTHGRTCVLTNDLTGYEFMRGDGARLPTRVSPPSDPHAFVVLRPGRVGHLDLSFSVVDGRPFTPRLLKFTVPGGGVADTVGWSAGPVGDNGRLRIGRLHF